MMGAMKAVKVDLGSHFMMVFHPTQKIFCPKPGVKNCRAIIYWPLIPAHRFRLENQTLPSGRLFFFKKLSQTRDSLGVFRQNLFAICGGPRFSKEADRPHLLSSER
jgi:hypothetical protein